MARITQKSFKEALINSGGNQARIAEKMEVTRQAINLFLKRQPAMRVLLEEEAERLIEWAEDNIAVDVMVHKDIDSSKWLLTNSKRGKSKGWGAKQELEHTGDAQDHIFNLIVKPVEEIKREKLDNQSKAT